MVIGGILDDGLYALAELLQAIFIDGWRKL